METLGELFDKLITTNIKLFWLEEELEKLQKEKPRNLEKIADLDIKRRGMTTRRRLLIIEIDKRLNEKNFDFRTV